LSPLKSQGNTLTIATKQARQNLKALVVIVVVEKIWLISVIV